MKYLSLLLLVLLPAILCFQGCNRVDPYPAPVDSRSMFLGDYKLSMDSGYIDNVNRALRIYSKTSEDVVPTFYNPYANIFKDTSLTIAKSGLEDIKFVLSLPNGKRDILYGTNLVYNLDTVRFLVQSLTLAAKDSSGKVDSLNRSDVLIQGRRLPEINSVLLGVPKGLAGGMLISDSTSTRVYLSLDGFHRQYLGKVGPMKYDSVYQTPFTRVIKAIKK